MTKRRLADYKRTARRITAGLFVVGISLYLFLGQVDPLMQHDRLVSIILGTVVSGCICIGGYPYILRSMIEQRSTGSWVLRDGEIGYIGDTVDVWSDGLRDAEILLTSELAQSALSNMPLVWIDNTWRETVPSLLTLHKEEV